MEAFLRKWRQDAEARNQYDTAVFVGDKVLALTDGDADAICLARLHFQNGNLSRAQSLLAREGLADKYPECRYLSANCLVKESKYEDALQVLGDQPPEYLRSTPIKNTRRKLTKGDVRVAQANGDHPESQHDVRFHAAMSYLRGICYAKQNAFDRAKECYKDAVRIDVQCFEAFDQLMKNFLMSPQEEWEFLQSLDFDNLSSGPSEKSSSQQAGEMVKMLYTTRLSKYRDSHELNNAVETLSTHYNLALNPDILLSKATLLFTHCKFHEALAVTTAILAQDRYNFATLPVHLACLHELHETNALFLLSHDLADHHPEEPASWLAVGVYYLTINKVGEARRWFSKASMMDPHFGPAWIGFAHTFAAEGEHDQAISAYSTAARLFQGTHLPQLFLGMQNLHLQNLQLAKEFLNSARTLCDTDPLLLNEIGVLLYHEEDMPRAINFFEQALALAHAAGADDRSWLSTRANLGHALRRTRRFADALSCFDDCLRLGGRDAALFAARGFCLLELAVEAEMVAHGLVEPAASAASIDAAAEHERLLWDAIASLHECLAISPQDAIGGELLSRALEQSSGAAMGGAEDEAEDGDIAEIEEVLARRKREAVGKGRRGREIPVNMDVD